MTAQFRALNFCDCFAVAEELFSGLRRDEMLFFRGLSDSSFDDIPNIYVNAENEKTESDIYHSLLLERPGDFDTKKHLSTLAKMQHYFSKTRLMDVTTDLLCALYFAVSDHYEKDCKVAVYKVKKNEVLQANSDRALMLSCLPPLKEEDKEKIKRFCMERRGRTINEDDIRSNEGMTHLLHEICGEYPAFRCAIKTDDLLSSFFVLANKDNERSMAQSGYFVIAGLAGEQAFLNYIDSVREAKIVIPARNKGKIQNELKILGVDDAYIYPSLERAALNVRNKRLMNK